MLDSIYSVKVILLGQSLDFNSRKTKVQASKFRFGLAIFAFVALDVAICVLVETFYFKNDKAETG
jgi:hypothetical protein